jgi:hypothetical protein
MTMDDQKNIASFERKCVLAGVCAFLFEYRHTRFCVSEILGQGCQMERFAGVECLPHSHLQAPALLPPLHPKRVVEFSEWVCGEVLEKVPHRHSVFSTLRSSGVIFFITVRFFRN